MKALPANRWLLPGLRVIVGAIFMHAGLAKMADAPTFAASLNALQLFPNTLTSVAATSLPWLEVLAGFLLVADWPRRLGAFATLALSGSFAVAISLTMLRGLDADCGCFGPGEPVGWMALGRDLLLATAAAFIYREACSESRNRRSYSTNSSSTGCGINPA